MPQGPRRPGPAPKYTEESRLIGAVTRARNKVNSIDAEYGAANIPMDNPLYDKRARYKQKHMEALQALREYRGE